jgi:hypothetical protein
MQCLVTRSLPLLADELDDVQFSLFLKPFRKSRDRPTANVVRPTWNGAPLPYVKLMGQTGG